MRRLRDHLHLSTPESIALLYLLLSGLWILFSDYLVLSLFATPETLTELQTVKGLSFVAATALLLYVLIRNSVQQLRSKEEQERTIRKALEERAATLDAVINSIPDAVFIGSEAGIDTMNTAARAMVGEMPEASIANIGAQMSVRDPDTGKQMAPEAYPFARALRGTSSHRELLVDGENEGTSRFVRASAAPIRKDGDIIGAVSVVTDITERKQREMALRQSQRNLAKAQRIAHVGSWSIDVEHGTLLGSDELYRIFGVTEAEFGGTIADFLALVHPEDRERVREAQRQALRDGFFRIQHRMLHPDGTVRVVQERGEVRFDEAGRAVSAVGTAQDITERKALEDALRTSEKQYRMLFFSNPLPMWIYDLETLQILEVNTAAVEQYGYTREAFLSKTLYDLRPASEHERFRKHVRAQRPELQYSGTWVHQRKDESLLEVEIVSHTLSFQGRDAVLVLGRDVTERNRIARENLQYNQELQTLLTVSRQLVSELDLPTLLDLVTEATVETLTQGEAASLWLYDETIDRFAVQAYSRHDRAAFDGLAVPADRALPDTEGPYVVEDAQNDPYFERLRQDHPTIQSLHHLQSSILVPLQIEARTIGFLTVDNFSQTSAFTAKDARLLQALAAQTTIAIQNSRLFRKLRVMSIRLLKVQETERRRIAQELHDEVGGMLTSLVLSLQMNPATSPEARAALDESQELVSTLMNQVRQLSLDLRPSTLDDLGLQPALEEYIRKYEARTQIDVTFQSNLTQHQRLAPSVETAAYRIVQEALTNVARHAETDEAKVCIRLSDETLQVVVQDEGRGVHPDEIADDSMGLSGMRERATLIGGHLSLDSALGVGTTLTASLPLEASVLPFDLFPS